MELRMKIRAAVRAEVSRLEEKLKKKLEKKPSKVTTFSHMVMGGIMVMFFVGVVLGVYATAFQGEPVSTTQEYIMKLAFPVAMGYFGKAFGENFLKIMLPVFLRSKDEKSQTISPPAESTGEQIESIDNGGAVG